MSAPTGERSPHDPGFALEIPLVCLPHGEGLPLPAAATASAAGLDLRAAVATPITLLPGGRALVPTGISIAIPEGYEGQVRPRSGLAMKHGVTVLNAPGTIDADFRGEICVLLVNHGEAPFVVARGERIAQLVLSRFYKVSWVTADGLAPTERGAGGYGSTGTR